MASPENVVTKIQDLLVYIVPQLAKFPRDQKFLLGDRIQTKIMDVQERCLRAYYSREKREHLTEANLTLEIVRHPVRLSYELRIVNAERYEVVSKKVDEIGRMIGGWSKNAVQREAAHGNA
jgi:hypothetical protein